MSGFSFNMHRPDPFNKFEKGVLYKIGDYNLIELHGSYREMGREYGALLKNELYELYEIIKTGFDKGGFSGEIKNKYFCLADEIFESYPERYKKFFFGMSETSGLTVNELKLINNLEAFYSDIYKTAGCSFLSAGGDYTKQKGMICARNFDGVGIPFVKYLTVTLMHPDDGSFSFAFIGYCGVIFVTTGINNKGLFLELNNAGAGVNDESFLFAPVTLWTMLENCSSVRELSRWMKSFRPDKKFNYIINSFDKKELSSFEWHSSKTVEKESDNPFLLVSTNHFCSSYWKEEFIGVENAESILRKNFLLGSVEKLKGRLDIEVLSGIISTPLSLGGVMFDEPMLTAFQVLYDVDKNEIYLRAPSVESGWTAFTLSDFL